MQNHHLVMWLDQHPLHPLNHNGTERVKHVYMSEKIMEIQANATLDIVSFEQLFLKNYDGLFKYCMTIIQEAPEAEDIVQSVFLDVWKDKDKLSIHTSMVAFLYKSVYFKSLNVLKHEKVVQKYKNANIIGPEPEAGDPMIYSEISEKIKQTIDQLPEQCRKIFSMSRMEGLKYHEIAARLKLSPKTVENQMGKALKTMKVALSEYIKIIVFILSNPFS